MRKKQKLNRLQHILPEPLLASVPWLESRGYSRALLSQYAAAGWLVQPTPGVYHRPGFRLCWEGVVTSLQSLMGCPLVVGGKTALEIQGHGHYISYQLPYFIHLYGPKAPPGWLQKLGLDKRFVFHKTRRLFASEEYTRPQQPFGTWDGDKQCFAGPAVLPKQTKQMSWNDKEMPLIVSTEARAALEHLDEVPKRERFDEAGYVMEKLAWLDPEKIQEVLCQCRSVKVKRLFLWFAERHDQPWFDQIDVRKIDLGRGKRMLVEKGEGCLNAKYQITYPKYMLYDEIPEDAQ
ncbi:MAG: type IV toxin-antitoxin system AbiEi family antitoxin domain-containing protein [Betaproteobacteria bacterium]|nr:type IV toxin-antitoxin system AbiEi family antitoxin domain-containing protein [Betaproteobacteria bacterium]